ASQSCFVPARSHALWPARFAPRPPPRSVQLSRRKADEHDTFYTVQGKNSLPLKTRNACREEAWRRRAGKGLHTAFMTDCGDVGKLCLHRHSRESGNPARQVAAQRQLGPRFRGDDEGGEMAG